MRLPVTPQISTKDGVSAKNARLTNCLKESKKGGDKAVVRPGLVLDAQASGVGHGLVVFNNELVSVYGATLGFGVEEGSDGGWTNTVAGLSGNGETVTYGNSMFYILDNAQQIYTTTNGVDVVERGTTGVANTVTLAGNLAAGNSLVCYIPGNGNVYWSDDDGDTWNTEAGVISSRLIGVVLSGCVHFDGTYFIASVYDDEGAGVVIRSTDCVTWADCGDIISGNDFAKAFCTGGGYTYAITYLGACAYSTNNGLTWTTHSTLTASRDVADMVYTGTHLVAAGDIGGTPYLYVSSNLTTFSETEITFLVVEDTPSFLSLIRFPPFAQSPTMSQLFLKTKTVGYYMTLNANQVLYSQLFSNAAWVKTNITLTATQTDPSAGTEAFTLTAGAANATMLQSVALTGTLNRTFSIYLKRKTGTGNISITADGATYSVETTTGSWARFDTTLTASGTVTCGIKIATSGDEVYAAWAQLEDGLATTYATNTANRYTVTQITDADYPSNTTRGCVFLDGRFFVMNVAGEIYQSALENAASWSSAGIHRDADRTGSGVYLAKLQQLPRAFKQYSTEFFYDARNATGSILSPVQNAAFKVGCASDASVKEMAGTVVWMGQTGMDSGGESSA
jgi:hypothetical protein